MKKIELKELNSTMIGQTISVNGIIEWGEKKTENGNSYLKVTLDDGTGRIYASIFPQNSLVQKLLEIPQMTRVEIVGKVGKVATTPRTANIFESVESIEIVHMNRNGNINIGKIQDALRIEYKKIKDPGLQKLVSLCLKNVPNLFEAPYSDNHYAYQGGLALYILRCLQLVDMAVVTLADDSFIVDARMDINYDMDILRAGIFLHRIGKTEAYQIDENGVVFKTLRGQMNGDVLESIKIVSREMNKVKEIPDEKKMLLEHLVSSSKKLLIWGALIEPKTKEAHLVHLIEQMVLNHSQFEAFNVDVNAKNGELTKGAFNKRYYVENENK